MLIADCRRISVEPIAAAHFISAIENGYRCALAPPADGIGWPVFLTLSANR